MAELCLILDGRTRGCCCCSIQRRPQTTNTTATTTGALLRFPHVVDVPARPWTRSRGRAGPSASLASKHGAPPPRLRLRGGRSSPAERRSCETGKGGGRGGPRRGAGGGGEQRSTASLFAYFLRIFFSFLVEVTRMVLMLLTYGRWCFLVGETRDAARCLACLPAADGWRKVVV